MGIKFFPFLFIILSFFSVPAYADKVVICDTGDSFNACLNKYIIAGREQDTPELGDEAVSNIVASTLIRGQVKAFSEGTQNFYLVSKILVPLVLIIEGITKAVYNALVGMFYTFLEYGLCLFVIINCCKVFLGVIPFNTFFYDYFMKSFLFVCLIFFFEAGSGAERFFSLVVDNVYKTAQAILSILLKHFDVQCPAGSGSLASLMSCVGNMADTITNPLLRYGVSVMFSLHISTFFEQMNFSVLCGLFLMPILGVIVILACMAFAFFMVFKLFSPVSSLVLLFAFAPVALFFAFHDKTRYVFSNYMGRLVGSFFLLLFQSVGIAISWYIFFHMPYKGTSISSAIIAQTAKNQESYAGVFSDNLPLIFMICLMCFVFSVICQALEMLVSEIFETAGEALIPPHIANKFLDAPVSFAKSKLMNIKNHVVSGVSNSFGSRGKSSPSNGGRMTNFTKRLKMPF